MEARELQIPAPPPEAWMSRPTYAMLLGYGLVSDKQPRACLHDGRRIRVNDAMPSTGIYDEPTPALARAIAAEAARVQEMAALQANMRSAKGRRQ